MISIMLVAGSGSEQLATFFNQKGTFRVDFVYNDLYSNESDLLRQIIKVDKLVYIYRINEDTGGSDVNIRMEMQTLKTLIQSGGFFQPKEFIFMSGDGPQYTQAKKYFDSVMTDCGITTGDKKFIDKSASFSSIYDNLLGKTLTKNFNNVYRPLYKKERGSTALRNLQPESDGTLKIEPFSYNSLREWEDAKKLASRIEDNVNLIDSDVYSLDRLNNPNFASIHSDDIIPHSKTILMTGTSRSGKTVWGLNMFKSVINTGKNVCFYDFSKSQDFNEILTSKVVVINPFDIISLTKCDGNAVCSVYNKNILQSILYFICKQAYDVFDVVVICMEIEDVLTYKDILRLFVTDIFCTMYNLISDKEIIKEVVDTFNTPKVIALRDDSSLLKKEQIITAEELKSEFGDVKIIKPMEIDSEDKIPWLYERIIGGIDE